MDATVAEEHMISQSWWFILIRGIASLLAGLLFLAWPGISIFTLTLFLGVWTLTSGIIDLIESLFRIGKNRFSWILLIEAALSIIVGLVILRSPLLSIVLLYQLFALWAVISGITQLIMAFFVKSLAPARSLMVISGIVSLLLGLILLSNMLAGFVAITWMLGMYGIVIGVFLTVFALQVRSIEKETRKETQVKATKKAKKTSKK